eukprot:gb/GECG01006472.1/.p1 GENE.gb/GECG01006472.1/~~gb/GECG01006472.1/.p1  ORF type:complete len:604 (+),score=175.96 gb/GECG01006472.1/:1-1812(+)
MDAQFLEHTVKEALTEGLSSAVAARPEDPVDYLGHYLLQYANRIEAEEQLRAEEELYEQEKRDYEAEQERQREEVQEHEDGSKQIQEEQKEIESLLEQCENVDHEILEKVINLVQKRTGATGVYVAKKEPNVPFEAEGEGGPGSEEQGEAEGGGGEEEEEEGAQNRLRYVAATSGHEHLLDKWITEKEGTTFKAWVMPEAAEGEEEEEEEEEEEAEEDEGGGGKDKEPKPEPELPTINVEDAVQDPNVKFFGIPKLGGFAAVPIRYNNLTHEEALPEITIEQPKGEGEEDEEGGGDEEQDEEEGEEDKQGRKKESSNEFQIPAGKPAEEDIAICFDAVGQNRSFGQDEIDYVKHLARLLRDAYNRAEQRKYEEEYKKAYDHKNKINNPPEGLNEDLETEASAVEEKKAEKTAELEEEAPEDKTQLIEALSNQSLAATKLKVYEKYDFLSCVSNSRIAPSGDALKVLQSVFYTLQYDKSALGNPNALDILKFSWETARGILQEDFISKLEQYDVNSVDTSELKSYQKSDNIKSVLENVDKEAIGSVSPIFPLLIDWVNAVLSGREAVEKRQQREQEEAEKAAAAAAEGEGDEENKEENEEEEDE